MAWDFRQLTNLVTRLDRAPKECGAKTAKAIDRAAQKVYTQARADAPVGETGNLRDSITIKSLGPFAKAVEADIHYASFVEYGTVTRHPEPYLIPAAQEADRGLPEEIAKAGTEPLE